MELGKVNHIRFLHEKRMHRRLRLKHLGITIGGVKCMLITWLYHDTVKAIFPHHLTL